MSSDSIPFPSQLKTTGNLASDWNRFCSQWRNYAVATDLTAQSKRKRAALFFVCVGTEAYETFQTMEFDDISPKEDIDKVINTFQKRCVGEVNMTYERYLFNKGAQEAGELFDTFLFDMH